MPPSPTGQENVTDLGAFSDTVLNPGNTMNLSSNTFNQATVGASNWSDVKVAYFILDANGNGGNGAAWATDMSGGKVNLNQFWGSHQPAADTVLTRYKNLSGARRVS